MRGVCEETGCDEQVYRSRLCYDHYKKQDALRKKIKRSQSPVQKIMETAENLIPMEVAKASLTYARHRAIEVGPTKSSLDNIKWLVIDVLRLQKMEQDVNCILAELSNTVGYI